MYALHTCRITLGWAVSVACRKTYFQEDLILVVLGNKPCSSCSSLPFRFDICMVIIISYEDPAFVVGWL